jgi:NADH-quinone oxidoreductase subunit L
VVWVVGLVTALLTAIFTFRMMFLTFWGKSRAPQHVQEHVHESSPVMTIPLVLLAVPAAGLGLLVGLPPEGGWIHSWLEPVFFDLEHEAFHWLGEGGALMLLSLAIVLVGVYVAYVLYIRQTELPGRIAARFPAAYKASLNKLYMDEVYAVAPIGSTIALSRWLWNVFDTKVIDGAVNGLGALWNVFGILLRPLQTGRVQNYALSVFAGMFILVIVLVWFWGA